MDRRSAPKLTMSPRTLADCENLTTCPHSSSVIGNILRLPLDCWLPVLQHPCDFGPQVFENVSLDLLKNPNINSPFLFRATILYDSKNNELTDELLSESQSSPALGNYNLHHGEIPGFRIERTILRRMIPRNPQLDKPIFQTCLFLKSNLKESEQTLVVYIPHSSTLNELPWYHPQVKSLAYLHSWYVSPSTAGDQGTISLHYRLYSPEFLPLSSRLQNLGQHLLSTVYKHGRDRFAGHNTRVHRKQLSQNHRFQNIYNQLKNKHAKRLCDSWVEQTEPSKHVFEDLGIAAFLIDLWTEMYGTRDVSSTGTRDLSPHGDQSSFPGFVDIGCGNGVLVDVLIREGYQGWGFDARRRKMWNRFGRTTQKNLKQMILVPQPLLRSAPKSTTRNRESSNVTCRRRLFPGALKLANIEKQPYHNGIFPTGTFIISNHADELTPWTPLLASISSSPFLCIPCCSHNLSGQRFRAPSVFNSNSADAFAPSYFAAQVTKSKAIPLIFAASDDADVFGPGNGPEHGDLKDLSAKSRSQQPSAYSSLCDWISHLAARVGYEVEKEILQLPGTRNVGILGKAMRDGSGDEARDGRRRRVVEIVREDKADWNLWIEKAKELVSVGGFSH